MSEPGAKADILEILRLLPHRYPFLLIDRILEMSPGPVVVGSKVVGLKNVSVNEPFFQGHFPGNPVMPGVLIVECMAQAAGCLFFAKEPDPSAKLMFLSGVDKARFRRPDRPGRPDHRHRRDRERPARPREDQGGGPRGRRALRGGRDHVEPREPSGSRLMPIHPTAVVDPTASVHPDRRHRPLRDRRRRTSRSAPARPSGAHAVIEGPTTIGEDNRICPLAALGGPPQDLKYKGEPTTLVIGNRNMFREFCTIHRGTVTGHKTTIIGDDNLFMAYAHVAHDCTSGAARSSRTARRSPATASSRTTSSSAATPASASSCGSGGTRSSARSPG